MLSLLRRFFQSEVSEKAVVQAPLFEILLFDRSLSFRLPKPGLKIEAGGLNSYSYSYSDQRPFVNTVSKQRYICEDEIGYYYLTLYHCGWPLYLEGRFAAESQRMCFELIGYGVPDSLREKFPDCRQPDITRRWLRNHYAATEAFFNSFYLQKHPEGMYEIVDEPAEMVEPVPAKPIQIEELVVNDLRFFCVIGMGNKIDYWLPFAEYDLVLFSFSLPELGEIAVEQHRALWLRCDSIARAVMASVALSPSSSKQLGAS